MGEDIDKFLVEPITNAARPATLAGLSMTVLRFWTEELMLLRITLTVGAVMFLLSSFFLFFYSIYTTRRVLRVGTAITFLLGLLCSMTSSIIMLVTI